eukprot:TRINITY_DN12298_c3_g1_i1.p2 TRINITY_DN12298_c3_g1~~TRINITY_DN12298_c3_g1_i1.p2  ORF type:complete len:504 (+),score=79.42 TRINITY_DN12298_c3_g1_i1:2602-4113(+)
MPWQCHCWALPVCLVSALASDIIDPQEVNFTDTHGLLMTCLGGATLVHLDFEPWCVCKPEAPYCEGTECTFTWAKLGQPSINTLNLESIEFEPYATANVTQATGRHWALFDGFSPECPDCTCYEAEQPAVPTLKAAIRRYQVLHSHVRFGLRERRILMTRGGVGGGWGDKLRGLLGCFLFAFQHDLAFFLGIDDPIPLESVLSPILFDWRYTPGIPGSPPGREKAMMPKPCDVQVRVMSKHLPERDTSRKPVTMGIGTNHWPIHCLFNWSRPVPKLLRYFSEQRNRYHEVTGAATGEHGTQAVPLPEDQARAEARGLHLIRSPSTTAFDMLFTPTFKLNDLRHQLYALHNMTPGQPYLAIHLRTALDFPNDRDRMREKDIVPSYECVLQWERLLKLPNTTKWLIAADYSKAHDMLQDWLEQQGLSREKVMGLRDLGGVISHVAKDDSERKEIGAVFAYFDFMMLTGSKAIFGNGSGFNRMAVAVSGHEQRVLLPHCVAFPNVY